MTTVTRRLPDWKTTAGYRILVAAAWGVIALAVFFGVVGSMFQSGAVWLLVAGLAVVVILVVLLLPEPVPHDMLIERSRLLDPADNGS